MIRWRDYLQILAEDGVSLAESENAELDEFGQRAYSQFLVRTTGDRVLTIQDEIPGPQSVVDAPVQRQIANRLRLPPEKYIFQSY